METSYAESYNTKDVDNEVLYHLVDFDSFLVFGLMYIKKRRDSAAITICSKNGRCLNGGFRDALVLFILCTHWYDDVGTEVGL